jgi:nitrite reductase/ring-hydroxylating ferredoxin subunit
MGSLSDSAGQARLMALADLPDGGLVEVEALVDGQPESLVLHRQGDAVRAWLNVCPHAGRRLDWSPGQFLRTKDGLLVCAAHGASFELAGGECVAGPCRGESLRPVALQVHNGEIFM